MDTSRLFIGLPVSAPAASQLARLIDRLSTRIPSVRWVPPENLHLTLKFLGDTPLERIPAIHQCMESAAANIGPVAMRIESCGCFPPHGVPRVLWAGVHVEGDGLLTIYQRLDDGLAELGIRPESRSFHPHITLGRTTRAVAREQADLRRVLQSTNFATHCWAEQIVLYSSSRGQKGVEYTSLATVPLAS
ncbi:MAG: RNA 2',3'-cyclic phosphodiesterase [Pirellulaceae bacterium]|nr:MAG: RNA 2',3'-cyclic phosphodiesterase [Pirellulaceae bacterium]